jgi:hypothetical protein
MDAERLFSICGNVVLPGWLLLAVAPRWKWTTRLIASVLLPGLMAIVYVYLIAANIGRGEGNFGSLAGVASFFRTPELLLAGWVHYLAFDLFVGCWEVRDAQRLGVRHWFVIPCLALTLMLGPAGLLAYFVVRWLSTRQILVGAEGMADASSPTSTA